MGRNAWQSWWSEMPPKKPLSDEEAALFEETFGDARPLKRGKPKTPVHKQAQPPKDEAAPKPAPVLAPRPTPIVPPPRPPLEAGAAIGLDRRLAERLKRGELPIEARLDLHGHRLNDAYLELERFIDRSAAAGRRCVLIVTGKGLAGGGALKREVPQWLNLPALRDHILAFAPAQGKHGGDGALYVLLKRRRENS
jgi:DNA-nicking Smr family endonuclease